MAPKKAATQLGDILQTLSSKDVKPKILLMGQAGAGKTSVMNYLAGFSASCGVKVKELNKSHIQGLLDVQLFDEDNEPRNPFAGHTTGRAQTSPAEYVIPITHSGHTAEIIVLDMPGFSDCRGVREDEQLEQNIVDVVSKQSYLTCVLLVVQGGSGRIHPAMRFLMTTISSLMTRDILQNVVVLTTFTDSQHTCKFPLQELMQCFELPPAMFYLDNPLAQIFGYERHLGKGSAVATFDAVDWEIAESDDDDDGEDGKNLLRWMAKGAKVMGELLEKVASFKPCATKACYEEFTKAEMGDKKAIEDVIRDGDIMLDRARGEQGETRLARFYFGAPQEPLLVTLHFGDRGADGLTPVVATNLGGEELASAQADLDKPFAALRRALRASLQEVLAARQPLSFMLPCGRMLPGPEPIDNEFELSVNAGVLPGPAGLEATPLVELIANS